LFLLKNVCVAANKPNAKRNFELSRLIFPKQSRKKKQGMNFFTRFGLIASIENIKQNIRENIVDTVFLYDTSIKILRLTKSHP